MSSNLKAEKKQILLDPVAFFCSQFPEANVARKIELEELWNTMQSLKKRSRELQAQKNIISRQIGEARQSNQPADSLIQSMQELSTQHKEYIKRFGDIEKNILAFFNIDETITLPETQTEQVLSGRQYSASIESVGDVTISLLNDEQSAWNDYVSKQPAATIHHRCEWPDLLKRTYGLESYYFLAHDKKQIVGILPLTRLKSRLFGDQLVSMPYFQRGGAIANHPLIEQKLIEAANSQAARLGVSHIEYRDDVPRDNMPTQSHKVNMVLSLPGSSEMLWKNFTPKLRAQIKRPQRLSPEVFIGGKQYLDDFYRVYTRNMRDLGSPAHSKQLIENILHSFPENSWIIVVYLDNKPVSAGLLLGHGDTMEIPLASTIRDVNPLSLNMLLYWEVLNLAIDQGYRYFDFGRSSKDAGTFKFKQQWGAKPKQLYWHYWLGKSGEMPSLNPSNPKYALVINIWKRLPLSLTKWLGPALVKNIP